MQTLKKARDFDRVFRSGQSFGCRELVLFVRPKNRGIPRVGYCVSKKLGKAVVRNRVRRRLRELVRRLEGEVGPGWDFVILARQAAVEASFQKLHDSLKGLMRKARKKKA